MLKIGGYVMTFKDAADWARRRFPGIDIYDEDTIPSIIEEHAEAAEGLKLTLEATKWNGKIVCIILTHSTNDPYATRTRFAPFPLDAFAIERGRKLFLSKEDLDKAEFVTICDPFDKGY